MNKRHTVGTYETLELLRTGSSGTVYRAFDSGSERIVALKVLHLDAVLGFSVDELSARIRNEVRALARLNHSAVVALFDYDDQDAAGPYMATEYVDGCALDQYLLHRPEPNLVDTISVMQ
jgi:serine/threonine-protein kinase